MTRLEGRRPVVKMTSPDAYCDLLCHSHEPRSPTAAAQRRRRVRQGNISSSAGLGAAESTDCARVRNRQDPRSISRGSASITAFASSSAGANTHCRNDSICHPESSSAAMESMGGLGWQLHGYGRKSGRPAHLRSRASTQDANLEAANNRFRLRAGVPVTRA